jgi:apolipoprotein N-acyltransferase
MKSAFTDRIPTWALLALGALATLATGPRWGIAALAWVAPVPYLLYARRVRGWRGWLALAGVLILAHPIQLLQIITPPIPVVAAFGFGLPVAVLVLAPLLSAELLRRRAGETLGLYSFACLSAIMAWVGYAHTELGAWTAPANTQVASLPLLQLTSLVGLAGLGFVMAWVAAAIASVLAMPAAQRRWRHALAAGATVLAALTFGTLRLGATHDRSVTVAAVVTDVGLTPHGAPSADVLASNTDTLFERTRVAAARGARLVVWNEVATLVEPADEAPLIARGGAEAHRLGVDLVLAYGVLRSRTPLYMENKYAFLTNEGQVVATYVKHHPVPAEPSVRGTEPLQLIERPYGRVAGALCYDYDFPALAREQSRLGAELVVVPSSDWRGIDPVHTQMASARAVEGGFSLLRSVRWGASGAFDAYGRVRAWMPVTEANDRVMLASLPIGRVPTLYSVIGDAPIGAAIAFVIVTTLIAVRRTRTFRRVVQASAPA